METKAEKIVELVRSECPALCRMERQLTVGQAGLLIEKFGYEPVTGQLRRMDNWKGIEKKNLSVYITCIKWFEEDIKRGYYQPPGVILLNPTSKGEIREPLNPQRGDKKETDERFKHVLTTDEVERRKREFLDKYPIKSEFEFNGRKYIIVNNRYVEELETGKMLMIEEVVSK